LYLISTAFNAIDLTTFIPNKLRVIFLSNALQLSILRKGIRHKFELDEREINQINSVLYQTTSVISELITIPEPLLKHVKFSEVISYQLHKIYQNRVPEVLKKALRRGQVEQKMLWNFLVSVKTGIH